MIRTLDDLIAYTQQLADNLPELRDSIVIKRPGCSPDAIVRLKAALAGIPQSYLDVVSAIDLNGIAIGYFQLSPGSGKDFVDKLVRCNTATANPAADRFHSDGVYQVASWEADPIGVAYHAGPFGVGQVVKYNVANPKQKPNLLADNFEHFLLLAVNLDAIRDKYADSDDPSQAIAEFQRCRDEILSGADSQIASSWGLLSEVVLS